MVRQWDVGTETGEMRSFRVPLYDQEGMPWQVRAYERCTWRSESMTLLDFLRKSNDNNGKIEFEDRVTVAFASDTVFGSWFWRDSGWAK